MNFTRQTDTCIGTCWHYNKNAKYKTPKTVIDMLVDIVSRNGNLLLNFRLPGSGMLDPEEMCILSAITDWMAINSEGIYSSRPWKISGIRPTAVPPHANGQAQLGLNENRRSDLTAEDVRFTTRGKTLYAFIMGWPEKEVSIAPLGTAGEQQPGKIQNVELLGHNGKIRWTQDGSALKVKMPGQKPCDFAVTLKVALG